MTQQRTRTPFEEGMRHFGIDLGQVRLYGTAPHPPSPRQCALVYIGPDEAGRQTLAAFATWLFPWLEERRRDIARLMRADDIARACGQIGLLAGATEVLRELGPWGTLCWDFALNMVCGLAENPDPLAQAYFEGGAELLREVLGITATRATMQPNTGRPARPTCTTTLVLGLPIGEPLRQLLQDLLPDEQMRLLEQLVTDAVDTYRFPFDPLAL